MCNHSKYPRKFSEILIENVVGDDLNMILLALLQLLAPVPAQCRYNCFAKPKVRKSQIGGRWWWFWSHFYENLWHFQPHFYDGENLWYFKPHFYDGESLSFFYRRIFAPTSFWRAMQYFSAWLDLRHCISPFYSRFTMKSNFDHLFQVI